MAFLFALFKHINSSYLKASLHAASRGIIISRRKIDIFLIIFAYQHHLKVYLKGLKIVQFML